MRAPDEDANDPERLVAICLACHELKTPWDLKEIARAKRLAEKHQQFVVRQSQKVTGRCLPSRRQQFMLEQAMGRLKPRSPFPRLGSPKR